MQNYESARVLIVGDVMLDHYYRGSTDRISPEAPVPVVHVKETDSHPGGAGNVALNIASLNGQVTLLGIVGEDEAKNKLDQHLSKANVQTNWISLPHHPTITKLRVLSQHQQMIRLDFEQALSPIDKSDLYAQFDSLLEEHNVVILSDYGKGTLSDPQYFIQAAKAKGKTVLVDPKGSSFEKYRGADLITPNFKEFTTIVGECSDTEAICQKGQHLMNKLDLGAILVTRGSEGMTLISEGNEPETIPTQARDVYDVTGAGDTVIAVLALSLSQGADITRAMRRANAAAGIVVGKVGSASCTPEELHRTLNKSNPIQRGIVNDEQAKIAIESAQARSEKVVFTNGCFDILHPGHVDYLKEAKAQGSMLIVAINSDESVAKLKGPTRPINQLSHRLEMLAALECVDWVVSFDDDTPKRLLSLLKPDVLVKGGDYRRDEIVGYDIVEQYGGTVKPLMLREGLSTTSIIEKIRQ